VLLAPACSSFDQFQDYEHRGRVFKELVERLAQKVESGSVRWNWDSKQETASLGSDVSGQLQAQAPAGPSQEAPEASRKPAPERLTPGVKEMLEQDAGPVEDDPNRRVTRGSTVETPPHELTLVYETNADEFPPAPAEDERAQDYPEPTETGQPPVPVAPEGIDDARLPYEGRAKEEDLAANGSAGRDFADSGTKGTTNSSRRSPANADRGNLKSAAPDSAPQARLPGMD
jgi:hypothetical protein